MLNICCCSGNRLSETIQDTISINTEIIDKMKSLGALSKPVILAIDWHDEMCTMAIQTIAIWCNGGTQPKKGSHHYAYRYATASVLIDGERLTVAVKPIVKGISLLEQVKDLLNYMLFEHKIKVKLMLFDRGYYLWSARINGRFYD